MMARVFFKATEDALNNITELFKLVHPLRTSMHYTRNAVAQMATENPNADDDYFKDIIDPGNNVHGTGFREAFIDTPWSEQEEQLAWLLLNNLFAIHEGWVDSIFRERFENKGYNDRKFIDRLQTAWENNHFTLLSDKFTSYYVTPSKRSQMLTDAFFGTYMNASRLDFSKIDNYMLMYRYFKAARNSFMHGNCIASQWLLDRYAEYSAVATETDLDVTEAPVIIPPVLGEKIHLNIRGVIGFSDFMQRILIISDITLLQTKAAEEEFLQRKPSGLLLTLNTNPRRAQEQIKHVCERAGFLGPVWSEELQRYMVTHRFISR